MVRFCTYELYLLCYVLPSQDTKFPIDGLLTSPVEAEGVLSQFQGSLDRPPALSVNVCHTVEVGVRGLAPRVAAVPAAIVNTREHLPHSSTAEIMHQGSIEVMCTLLTFVLYSTFSKGLRKHNLMARFKARSKHVTSCGFNPNFLSCYLSS